MKFTRYGLLVRRLRIESGDSVAAASRKIGVTERELVNVEDRGYPPPIMFDLKFRRTYPQNKATGERLKRFFVEASRPQILRKCR